MKLMIMQHGEAVPADTDPDRPLSERGRADVEGVARRLAAAGVAVRRVRHSGKTRARQSAEILASCLDPAEGVASMDGISPKDSPLAFVDRIEALEPDTLLATHLPFAARLVSVLLTGNEQPELVAFEPATVACLERDGDGAWRLAWMLRPALAG